LDAEVEMKAVWLEGGKVEVRDVAEPAPGEGSALLRLRVAGVCRTDCELLDGYMGFKGIPGHEFVATVMHSPDASMIGRRVVGSINIPCGSCRYCRTGKARHCPARKVLGISGHDGCMAEYFTLPAANLVPLPDFLSDYDAVFAEPLAAALRIEEQVVLSDRVLVVGDGKLGLLVATVLQLSGHTVFLRGHHDERLDIVRPLGVAADDGAKFPEVVDCTGTSEGYLESLSRVEPEGVLILKSTFASSRPLDMAPQVVNEITVIGSRCGRIERALEWLPKPAVYEMLSRMRAVAVPLVAAEGAFELARRGQILKVFLDNLA